MFRRLVAGALALMAAGVVSVAHAQIAPGDKWVLLGVRDVDLTYENDSIDVTKARGRFKALRLIAADRGIELSRVQVVYGNGAVHNEDRKITLLPGERTRPIDLRGDERFVDQVHLVYRTEPGNRQRAKVEVWGLQSSSGAAAARTGPGGGTFGSAPPLPPTGSSLPPIAATVPSLPPAALPKAAAAGPGIATQPASPTAPPSTFGDVLFGTQTVGFGVDKDVIKVGTEIGKFDKVRFRILDNDIYLISAKVIYSNGEPDEVAYNAEIKQNTRTRWITLKGDRFIDRIELLYRSKPNFKGTARVEVFGEYAEGWLGPQGEGRKFNQGWVLLGAQSAALRIGFDKDVVPVGKNEGGFKKIRLNVKDRAITLKEIKIVYGTGETDIIPVNTRVDAGSSYGPLDLIGRVRTIKEVELTYRSRFLDASAKGKGAAVVEVWGLH